MDETTGRYERGDLVEVSAKSRGRFPGDKALPGQVCMVLGSWIAQYSGTYKLNMLTQDSRVVFTTHTCIDLVEGAGPEMRLLQAHNPEWYDRLTTWIDETHIPIVGLITVLSLKKQVVRIKPLIGNEFWVGADKMHPRDWALISETLTKGKMASLRVPLWIAEKNGLFGKNAS